MAKNKSSSQGKGKQPINPHDSFFKETFSDKEVVKSYLQGSLPKRILQKLRLSSLKPDKASYVDDELNNHFADVVYDCQYGENASLKLVFLFEHKSSVPEYPHIQLLRYTLRIWETQIKQKKPLQPVLPIIIYHGQQKWKVRSFESYFQDGKIDPDLLEFIPYFNYLLTDLQQSSNEEIKSAYDLINLRLAFLLMKHIQSTNILEILPFILEEAKDLIQNERGIRYFRVIELYSFYGIKKEPKKIKEIMESLFTAEPPVGSAAWQMVQEGKQEGKEEANHRITINLIKEGLSNELISRAIGLSIERIIEIRKEIESKK